MWQVYTVNKSNHKIHRIIANGLTEAEAESICEAWGWNYIDEYGVSFWIDYELEN